MRRRIPPMITPSSTEKNSPSYRSPDKVSLPFRFKSPLSVASYIPPPAPVPELPPIPFKIYGPKIPERAVDTTNNGYCKWSTRVDGEWWEYTYNKNIQTIATDSKQNVYISAMSESSSEIYIYNSDNTVFQIIPNSTRCMILVKYNTEGMALWYVKFNNVDYRDQNITIDKEDNIYCMVENPSIETIVISGTMIPSPININIIQPITLITKIKNGTLDWYTYIIVNTIYATLATDTDNNLIFTGVYYTGDGQIQIYNSNNTLANTLGPFTSPSFIVIVKYTSSGFVSWNTYSLNTFTQGENYALSTTIDSTNNIYINGYCERFYGSSAYTIDFYSVNNIATSTISSNGTDSCVSWLVKYTPSGYTEWVTKMTNNVFTYGSGIDSEGNIYLSGTYDGICTITNKNETITKTLPDTVIGTNFIVKYTGEGEIAWALYNNIDQNSSYWFSTSIAIDKQDNCYVYVYGDNYQATIRNRDESIFRVYELSTVSDSNSSYLIKYNKEGTVIWCIRICTPGQYEWIYPEGVTVDSLGNVSVVGTYQASALIIYNQDEHISEHSLPPSINEAVYLVKFGIL